MATPTTYESYKPSGIDWIGDIPSHWETRKVSRSFNIIGSGTTPKAGNEDYYEDGVINWINTGDLNDAILTVCNRKITAQAFGEHSTLKIYPVDTLLIAMYGATIGKVSLTAIEGCTNQACCALADSMFFLQKFVFYWFIASRTDIINLSYGGGQPNISQEIVRFLKIPAPPLAEQAAIARYLDTQTTQLDTLIDRKRRLMDLLREEKAALINEAVTKGINPGVEMRDSGIAWLGEVPAHWEVKKLKWLGQIKYGLGQPPKLKDDGLPLIRATNVFRGRIEDKDLVFVDPEDVPYDRDPILKENDIIVVRSGAYTGDSAIIPKRFEGAVTGYDMMFRATAVDAKLISYCLLSNYVHYNQLLPQSLRAAQPHLNREELSETIIFNPPLTEQAEIVAYLNTETARIDHTISRIEREVELMQEYRTALISEVVTGKVCVV